MELCIMTEPKRIIPLAQWQQHHSWPPTGGMRHIRFHQETNGFKDAFLTVGSRVLVDEEKFFAIIEQQNNGGIK
jgi:hypothetical protein